MNSLLKSNSEDSKDHTIERMAKEYENKFKITKTKEKKSSPSSSNSEFNTGRWTNEEHKKFWIGLERYGNNWKKIRSVVVTRTETQIKTHYQKHVDDKALYNKSEKHFQIYDYIDTKESIALEDITKNKDPSEKEEENLIVNVNDSFVNYMENICNMSVLNLESVKLYALNFCKQNVSSSTLEPIENSSKVEISQSMNINEESTGSEIDLNRKLGRPSRIFDAFEGVYDN